jgi:hypothetical protein
MPRATVTRQHILEEIKRTAAENSGVPLGRARFFQETGIKISDWEGKLWVRWSEAMLEAGFSPNEFNAAYDKEFLLEKLALFIRELGRFPVRNENKMKARTDKTFPSANTFARFGSKRQFAKEVYEFCKDRPKFADILPVCEAATGLHPHRESKAESEDACGFVYLMKSGRFYKVGRSNAAGRREYELAIQMPDKLTTVPTIRTDDPAGIEEYWHKRFAEKRKNGEWFDLESQDVQAFKRRKFM